MTNCFYDKATDRTRCGEVEGEMATYISSNFRVSCPRCWDTLTPEEREVQWYGRSD